MHAPAPVAEPMLSPLLKYTPNAAASDRPVSSRSGKVEPLPAIPRASLPQLDITMNKPKVLPDVPRKATAPAHKDVDLTKMSALEVSEHLAANGDEVGFVYLVRAGAKASADEHSYNLKVVPHERIDQTDFFTMSQSGVTHSHDGYTEFTPLARWQSEYRDFHRLRKLKTFRQFRMWKAFAVWRKNLFNIKLQDRRAKLQQGLFIVNDLLRNAIIDVRTLCLGLSGNSLCNIDPHKTYDLDEFVDCQNTQAQSVISALQDFRNKVKEVVLTACTASLRHAGYLADDDAGLFGLSNLI